MKVKAIAEGSELRVGDYVKHDTAYRVAWFQIHRVTKKYAFVKYNETAEGKFPIVYQRLSFRPLPREKWDANNYQPYRPVEPEVSHQEAK